jgi:hypothetical protein
VGGPPPRYTAFKEVLPRIQHELQTAGASRTLSDFDLQPLPLHTAMMLHSTVLGGMIATCQVHNQTNDDAS